MDIASFNEEIHLFSKVTHGSTDYYKSEIFIAGANESEYAPLEYLKKKFPDFNLKRLYSLGYVHDSFDFYSHDAFASWYERQFGRKLKKTVSKDMSFVYLPNNKAIFDAIEKINESYLVLKKQQILINNKKMPVQLGEWYAKSIFGLKQVKSSSQRGFDFYLGNERVEVKVHWDDHTSPKGVKIRKSLVELSNYCIIIYIFKNFMIREICVLDSKFVARRFSGKGHTIFLKDATIGPYFFTNSNRHMDKVINKVALMKYVGPTMALRMAEHFS